MIKPTVLVLSALALCTVCDAKPVTIKFTAEVTEVYDWTGSGQFSDIVVGELFKGTYTYDDAVVSTVELDWLVDVVGDYPNTDAGSGFDFKIGETIFESSLINTDCLFEMVNDYFGQDNYVYHSYNNLIDGQSAPNTTISLQLDDYTQTALSSVAIPLSAPDLGKWTQQVGLTVQNSGFFLRAKLVAVHGAQGHRNDHNAKTK